MEANFSELDNYYPYLKELLSQAPSESIKTVIPDNLYTATIEKIYKGYTRKGAEALKTVFSICDEAYKGTKIYLSYVIPQINSADYQVVQILDFIKQLNPDISSVNEFLLRDLSLYAGKNCIIELKTNKSDYQVPKLKKVL